MHLCKGSIVNREVNEVAKVVRLKVERGNHHDPNHGPVTEKVKGILLNTAIKADRIRSDKCYDTQNFLTQPLSFVMTNKLQLL